MYRRTAVPGLRTGIIGLLLALAVAVLAAPAQAASRAPTHIVQLRPDVSLYEGRAIVRAAGGRVTGALPIIHGLAASLPAGAGSELFGDPAVAGLTINAGVRNSNLPDAVGAGAPATAYPYSVLAPRAWASATGRGVGVAVIDTGIDGSLPDFWDTRGGSRVVASAVTNPDAKTAGDAYGHGTHVAGIIAGNGSNRTASDPLAGQYMGIAPEADLISVKVGDDDGNATVLDVIYGLQFAVEHKNAYNIRVVNLSLESTVAQSYRTDPLDAAVESAHFHGILVVAAAGNHGRTPEAADFAPGNDPFALTVGAVDDKATADRSDDAYTEWSSVGQTQDGVTKPEIAAPGSQIVSTLAGGSDFSRLCASCVVERRVHPGRRNLDGGADRLRRRGARLPAPSRLDAGPGQEHAHRNRPEPRRQRGGGQRERRGRSGHSGAGHDCAPGDPNELVDAATGEIDYTRSSWSRSSWSTAPESLIAGWARSSWSCACFPSESDEVDPTRSSWSRSSWSRSSWSRSSWSTHWSL